MAISHNKHDPQKQNTPPGERIAKYLARAGICSRREAERLIADGRVTLDGRLLTSPAVNVTGKSRIAVDDKPVPAPAPARLWRYYKPRGQVTTSRDPQGRPTVFDALPADMPRVISVGRLDINSEGLLLLTNDGALARRLELPATGLVRRYRARVFGKPDPAALDALSGGVEIEGVRYGAIQVRIDRQQRDNAWLTVTLAEGKNREVRRVLAHLGLRVNRLIRLSYGPFQLGQLEEGAVAEVPPRILADQLGEGGREGWAIGRGKARQDKTAGRAAGRAAGKKPAGRTGGKARQPAPGKNPTIAKKPAHKPVRDTDPQGRAKTAGRAKTDADVATAVRAKPARGAQRPGGPPPKQKRTGRKGVRGA